MSDVSTVPARRVVVATISGAVAMIAAVLAFESTAIPAAAETGGSCVTAAAQARDNIALRIQQSIPGGENRESARAHVAAANMAAAAGKEQECWKQLRLSDLSVGLPAAPAAALARAASSTASAPNDQPLAAYQSDPSVPGDGYRIK